MIKTSDILETLKMIRDENLDVRTVTMGISLLDSNSDDIDSLLDNIERKIIQNAGNLVETCDKIERKYDIPIVNKRISVTPISLLLNDKTSKYVVTIAKKLDEIAKKINIDFIGGFSALVESGFTKGDIALINALPEVLSSTERICASLNIASTKAGINMDAVIKAAFIIKKSAELTADKNCIGPAKFVVFSNAVNDNPFMAGAFHGITQPDRVINVGVSGPGTVENAIKKLPKNADLYEISDAIKKIAFKITRMGELIGKEVAKNLNTEFGIIDLSLAPTPKVGDSVATVLEAMGLDAVGSCGTTAALALLNDAVKKGGSMAGAVGGLSGAFIPVSEDAGMIKATLNKNLNIEKLEAMTAVCSVGLDMIAIPGDTDEHIISGLIADEMAVGMINNKTTAVRLIPAINKKEGEMIDFGGLLGSAPVMHINTTSPKTFIERGGKIPAPIHSLKN
ncbi:MAG: PFL family protein [Clostridiales Family XIII bacterium]|jgi:uncharacterized protein (UPF0210 family)|nr:PFL family protein [Clostridiales Family XIII bacterium]